MRQFPAASLILGLALWTSLLPAAGMAAETGRNHSSPVIKKQTSDWVNAAAFSPSGNLVAMGFLGQISLYSCPQDQLMGTSSGHSKYVQGLAFSPRGETLYSIGWDGMLCSWQIYLSDQLSFFPEAKRKLATAQPQCLAVLPDGTRVATGGKGSAVDLYDGQSLAPSGSLSGLESTPTCLATDPVRNRLVAGDKKGRLAVWNTVDSKLIKRWQGHGKKITGLVVDPSSGDIISGDGKGELKRWNSGNFKTSDKANFDDPIRGLQISPDGRFLYLALKTGQVRLLGPDFVDAAGYFTVKGRPACLVTDGRGRYLACGTDQNEFQAWDLMEIREVQIAYDIPARLEIAVEFNDSGALIPNRALDGGEKLDLLCRIKNVGEGTAYDAHLNVACDYADISFPAMTDLGDILAGAEKVVPIPLEVALEARDGKANFDLHVSEKKQNGARTALGLTVRYLPKPDLAITLIELEDLDGGSIVGNGNGIPENNETVEVVAYLQNKGDGPAWRNRLVMTECTAGVNKLIDTVDLPAIPAGGSTSGRIRLQIPKTFTGDALAIDLQVTDAVTGHRVRGNKTWQAKQNVPVLAARWKIVQGLQNGRSGRLQLVVENTGTLAAENINITLSNDQGLAVDPSTLRIPRLATGEIHPGFSFGVTVPTFFKTDQVAFQARITQALFSETSSSQTFDIDLFSPVLKIQGLPANRTITRGESLYLDLALANEGQLDAQDVVVTVVADKLGKPFRFDIGALPSHQLSPFQVSWPVPMDLSTGSIDVEVQVTQKYFASAVEGFNPEVVAEQITRTEIEASAPAGALLAGGGGGHGGGSGNSQRGGLGLDILNEKEKVRDPHYLLNILAQGPPAIRSIKARVNGTLIYNLAEESQDLDKLRRTNGLYLDTEIQLRNMTSGQNNLIEFVLIGEGSPPMTITRNIFLEELGFELTTSLDVDIDVNAPRPTGRRNPDAVAFLIGVSEYAPRSGIPPVEFARQDVLAVKQTLIETMGYDPERIVTLIDGDATWRSIYSVLDYDLPELVVPGRSDVFVYYSGHGAPSLDKQSAYLVPHDANPAPENIKRSGYLMDDFYAALAKIEAKQFIVAIDACFSGKSENGDLFEGARPLGVTASPLTSGQNNCVVFSASDSHEVSWGYKNKQHGLFTYFFLKGLQGAAGGNRITAEDLQEYVEENVGRVAKDQHKGFSQTPKMKGPQGTVLIRKN